MDRIELLLNRLKQELNNETYKYKRLKYCKYALIFSKNVVLSLSVGLSFISAFNIIGVIYIPIVDSILAMSNKEQRISKTKLKEDLIQELIHNIEDRIINIKPDSIDTFISEVQGRLISINTM